MASWTFFTIAGERSHCINRFQWWLLIATTSTVNRFFILKFEEEIDFNIYFWNGFLPHQIQSSFYQCRMIVEWYLSHSGLPSFVHSCFVLYGDRTAIKCTHQSMFDHKICINCCCCFLFCCRPSILYFDRNILSLTFRWGKVVKTQSKYFSLFFAILFDFCFSFVLFLFRDS